MLAPAEKSILQKGKTKKGKDASENYKNRVKSDVKEKAEKALKDLEMLAQVYPEAIQPELLLKFVESYLNQKDFVITMEEREIKRLPPSFGRKSLPKNRKWYRIGDLREKSGSQYNKSHGGAPLKKKHGQKMSLIYDLLTIIKRSLEKLSLDCDQPQPISLSYKDGTYTLSDTT